MSSRIQIFSLVIIMAMIASAACFAQESVFYRSFRLEDGISTHALSLRAAADTTGRNEPHQEWSSDEIKDLLARETGEPDIEGTMWQKRKNPRTAMLCALIFPGLGQVYNEKALKAVIALGVETYYIMNVVHNYRKADDYLKERDSYDKYVSCGPQDTLTCINPDWSLSNSWHEEYKERTIDWIWWTSAAVLVIMLDAYVDAHLHDMRFRLETARRGGGTGLAVVVDF